ncbi:MAG: DUF3892 domain-containing protein [Blastocatellia bacterium]|nr:MAG: DUF3892 domain-containing protein [Blastocatellia bacterium]
MALRLQIDCTSKDDQLDPYRRIRRVGGPNLPGTLPPDASKVMSALRKRGIAIAQKRRWKLSIDEAIEGVVGGKWSFFIELGIYETVNIEVARSPSGQLYLKSEIDEDTPDQLLVLPECR